MSAGLVIGAVLLIYGAYETFRGIKDNEVLNMQTEGEVVSIREREFVSKFASREPEQIPTIKYAACGKEYRREFFPALHKAREMFWVGKKYTVNFQENDPNNFDLKYGKRISFIYLVCMVAGVVVILVSV